MIDTQGIIQTQIGRHTDKLSQAEEEIQTHRLAVVVSL